jgi:outer membrane protein assembly factor BamB
VGVVDADDPVILGGEIQTMSIPQDSVRSAPARDPQIERPTTDDPTSPYPYDADPIDWWGWGRTGLAYVLTVGLLALGLGYCLVYSALEGRYPPPRVLLWFVPATVGVIGLTWGLGQRAAIKPWGNIIALALVAGWFGITFYLGSSMTTARESHWLIIGMYGLATLWMPWLAWIGWTGEGWFSRLSVLVVLCSLLYGFHYLVAVPGLTGDRQVQLALRKRNSGLIAATTAGKNVAVSLDPTPYDYPQYLGPKRNASFQGIELDLDWKKAPPEMKWRHAVGKGWSSFAIVGDFAFTQEQRGDDEAVVCYALRTGETVWVHSDRDAFRSTFGGDGPRATPLVRDGMVFTVGATGIVNCLAGDTGQVMWSTRIRAENDANLPHGICGSPLLVGDLLYVCPVTSADESFLALDARTGKKVFSAGGGRAAYSSPVLVELANLPQILTFNADGIASHDVKTGSVLWKHPWGNDQGVNASQPIVFRDEKENVFLSTSYGKGSTLLAVDRNAAGEWSIKERWKTPKFRNQFSTSVLYDDMAIGLDDGILAAIDLRTGKVVWKQGRYGHGQIIQVGRAILVLTEGGDLVLIDPRSPKKELAVVSEVISGKTWNHLAISPPFLLVRNAEEAACYKLTVADESTSAPSPPTAPPAPPVDPQAQSPKEKKGPTTTNVTPTKLPPQAVEPLPPAPKKKPAETTKPRPSAFEDDLTLPSFDSPKDSVPPSSGSATDPLPPLTQPKPKETPTSDPLGLPPVIPPPPTGTQP